MFLRKYKTYLLSLSLMVTLLLMGLVYKSLNNGTGGARVLNSPVDGLIPLVPWMSLPYLGWYPFIFAAMAYLCLRDTRLYLRVLLAMNICLCVCYLIYAHFQTTVPRPVLSGSGLGTRLLRYVYSEDRPYNCFPSIHALHSYLVMRGVWASRSVRRRYKLLISAGSITIIASTLLIKQHVIYDAAAAALLGETVFMLLGGIWIYKRRQLTKWRQRIN
ncbi:phosphatase PAP2 family protein [Paenibacillus sp. JX-17]|uniref:Phosphatase PAP2 family protein n=1 Tax=Paenibacillus lacisoli TaxID=3064525 RepID=A0ABT9CBR9_9BACL|nr:phosphatase PAP2 family protein [Paenibacillus sp. JX-17]MDO7906682.1 phosphatase PAP2 family protein [Paenibacillus sp. JX-17]